MDDLTLDEIFGNAAEMLSKGDAPCDVLDYVEHFVRKRDKQQEQQA